MGNDFKNLTRTDRAELFDLAARWPFEKAFLPFPFFPYISGVEITQAIQYYKASSHLTDPSDRGPDNSLGLAAFKPAWVRVYVRSGFFGIGTTVTGKIVVERLQGPLPFGLWITVGEYKPTGAGIVVAPQSADYATERGAIGSTLNFIIPGDDVLGRLRIRAVIWPQGGTDASPSDTDEIYADATLLQTLRVRGILVSYNGPNASGTVANMNLAAPTVADLQTSCGNTHTVYPVESTGVFSSGGTIAWATPLTGLATSPGGCSQQWLDLNVAIAQARTNDGNRTDVLYVGLIPAGVPIANVGGCNSSGVSAVPNGQQWTMAHELGHACGLSHGPCGTPGDANYPAYEPYDPANSPTASLGEYGLDINNGTIHPPSEKDFMSYCNPVWISLYHYGRLYDNSKLDPRWVGRPHWHIPVLYDPWLWPWEYIPDPPSWELPSHFVQIEVQPLISIVGVVDLSGELNVSSVVRMRAVPRLPESTPTNMVAQLIGANGKVVASASLMQTEAHGAGCGCHGHEHGEQGSRGYAFQALLSDVEAGSALRIVRVDPEGKDENKEIWRRDATSGPPKVRSVTVSLEKKKTKPEATIRWEAKAAEENSRGLEFSIQFSKDKGASWNGLVAGLRETGYRFSLADLPSGTMVFRVFAHDGYHSSHADSRSIRLPARAPVVSILHPQEGRTFEVGMPLRLFAAVSTHLGAKNAKLEVVWQIDGKRVGQGADYWIDAPKAGRHKCRVFVSDDGGTSESTVTFVTEGKD